MDIADVTSLALPLTFNPDGGAIMDANGREIAALMADVTDAVALELLRLVNITKERTR